MFSSTPKDFQTTYEGDTYLLWPFGKKLIYAIVARSTVCNSTLRIQILELSSEAVVILQLRVTSRDMYFFASLSADFKKDLTPLWDVTSYTCA